jgi:heme-degrading monooxygenase HmoA
VAPDDRPHLERSRAHRGRRRVRLLHREFLTFSLWESVDAIRAFAGDDIETAVYYPDDDRYLIERDATVRHYEVVDSAGAD